MAAAAQTGKLVGDKPEIFTGNRTQSDTFLQQFNLWRGLNENHEVMDSPYFRTMNALSLIKGPLVQTWVNSQVNSLREKTTRAQNQIGRDQEVLWTDFVTAFETAFTHTTKEQDARKKLKALKMYKDNLDLYIATFKQVAEEAGYAEDAAATIHMFANGLEPKLLMKILNRENPPETFPQWETAARTELQKRARIEGFFEPHKAHYQWQTPKRSYERNGDYGRQPNDRTVPMDVDLPVFTQIRRAYTDEDKRRFKREGRCFNCDRQGHMARECPGRKQQAFVPNQPSPTSVPNQPNPTFRKKQFGNFPPKRRFGNQQPGIVTQRRAQFKSHYVKPQARTASIEEVEDDQDQGQDQYDDDQDQYSEDQYEEEQSDVPSIAARTAKFTEEEREVWLQEMRNKGINF